MLLMNMAMQVAQSIGLLEQHKSLEMTPPEAEERRNVMYCLLLVKNSAHWATGWTSLTGPFTSWIINGKKPDHSGFIDTHMDCPPRMTAKLKLARIDERVYSSLFARDSLTRRPEGLARAMAEAKHALAMWWNNYGGELEGVYHEIDSGQHLDSGRVEQLASFVSIRIMVSWPAFTDLGICFDLLQDARKYLQLVTQLWSDPTKPKNQACLTR